MFVPLFPYPVVGGLERQALRLAKTLARRGIGVSALSGKILPHQHSEEMVEGVKVYRLSWPKMRAIRYVLSPFSVFFAILRLRNTFDVLHVHQNSLAGLFAVMAGRFLGKPVLTKLPNIGHMGIPGIAAQPFGRLRLAVLKSSSAIVAMAPQSLAELKSIGYPFERVLVTPNGIDVKPCPPRPGRAGPPLSVIFLGRFSREKNIPVLIEAWRSIASDPAIDARLDIWGDGPLRPTLEALASDPALKSTVTIHGFAENISEILAKADAFVLPSHLEGNSNAILEAMEAGLPVIATRVGGSTMQLGAEGAPLMCQPGNVEELADRLRRVLTDTEFRLQTGIAMRARIEEYFDIERVADTYFRAYTALHKSTNPAMTGIGGIPGEVHG